MMIFLFLFLESENVRKTSGEGERDGESCRERTGTGIERRGIGI